jgi:putative sigma-54 modulation protein
MEVKVHAVGFKADKKLVDFATAKVLKLEQFSDHIVITEVFFKVDNTQSEENKVAEVKLLIPGSELFAKKQSKTFEESIDLAVDALKKQIEKAKNKEH